MEVEDSKKIEKESMELEANQKTNSRYKVNKQNKTLSPG